MLVDDGGTANGGSDRTSPATFTINVTPVNDPPEATPVVIDTVLGGSWAGQVQITDPDGPIVSGTFTYQLTGIARLADLVLDPTTGAITFKPTATGSETVTFSVSDGTSTITSSINIWVDGVSDSRPLISSTPNIEVVVTGDSWAYHVVVDPTTVLAGGNLSGYVGGIPGATITKVTGNTFDVNIPSLLISNGSCQQVTIIISDTTNHQADTQNVVIGSASSVRIRVTAFLRQ
ncbi:MAG: Ig-like domain-containing protein [Paludibaculum sp.]